MNVALFRALATLALLRPGVAAKDKKLLRWALEDDSRISATIKEAKKKPKAGSAQAAGLGLGDRIAAINLANIVEALKAFLELLPQLLAILDLLKKQKPAA